MYTNEFIIRTKHLLKFLCLFSFIFRKFEDSRTLLSPLVKPYKSSKYVCVNVYVCVHMYNVICFNLNMFSTKYMKIFVNYN